MSKAKAKAKAKVRVAAGHSGVGLSIDSMNDVQFESHLNRVLGRMKEKGASMDNLKAASLRVKARRSESLKA